MTNELAQAEIIKHLLGLYLDLAYETGWLSGKVEAGGEIDRDYQAKLIAERNDLGREIFDRIDDLVNNECGV
jgi:hypothetical protein